MQDTLFYIQVSSFLLAQQLKKILLRIRKIFLAKTKGRGKAAERGKKVWENNTLNIQFSYIVIEFIARL